MHAGSESVNNPVEQCSVSLIHFFTSCFQFFTVDYSGKRSWTSARDDCLSRGADLISLHNVEEETFIAEYTKGRKQWIGLSQDPVNGGASLPTP